VLDGAADAHSNVQLRRNNLASLAHLVLQANITCFVKESYTTNQQAEEQEIGPKCILCSNKFKNVCQTHWSCYALLKG
jgi:hypothetical protein